MSNRNFTRRVLKGGGYFTQLMVNGEIHIYFLLMLKEGKNTEIIRSNFKMRTQKILPTSGVKVVPFSEIEDSEVSDFIINSSEMKMIQPIRETYINGLKGQWTTNQNLNMTFLKDVMELKSVFGNTIEMYIV